MFANLAEAFAEHPPEDRASIEDDYVAATGMLPAALRDSLIGGMLSEDPAAQVAAAGRFVGFFRAPVVGQSAGTGPTNRPRISDPMTYEDKEA